MESLIQNFKIENKHGEDVSITLYTEENKDKKDALDLVVNIEFIKKLRQRVMNTIIKGDNQSAQIQFILPLGISNRLA